MTSALAQLRRVVQVVARHHPQVAPWHLLEVSEGLQLEWHQASTDWRLLFEPRHEGSSFANSASCSVSIRVDGRLDGLDPTVEAFIQTLVAAAARRRGGLALSRRSGCRARTTALGRAGIR